MGCCTLQAQEINIDLFAIVSGQLTFFFLLSS